MNKTHKKNGKSLAKSYGLKAVFANENNALIAVSGKKNETILEQSINTISKEKEIFIDPTKFNASIYDESFYKISVTPEGKHGTFVNNPLYVKNNKKVGEDYLGLKDTLEKRFFGNTFNDNIHIQIAYKILDIKKIIGLHIGNVVHSLCNLQKNIFGSNQTKDVMGTLSTEIEFDLLEDRLKEKDKLFIDNLLCYSRYFDGVFEKNSDGDEFERNVNNLQVGESFNIKTPFKGIVVKKYDNYALINIHNVICYYLGKIDLGEGEKIYLQNGTVQRGDDKDKFNKKTKKYKKTRQYKLIETELALNPNQINNSYSLGTYEHNYNILRILSYLRQASIHNKKDYDTWFYNIDSKAETKELLLTANKVFDSQMDTFNNDFKKQANKNLYMILKVKYNKNPNTLFDEEIEEEYKNYYKFVLHKENRNIGINLRKIRNNIVDIFIVPEYDQRKLNAEKSKINTLLDYFIYDVYYKNEEQVEKIILELQASRTDEEKEEVYSKETSRFINDNPGLVDKILNTVSSSLEESYDDFIPSSFVCKESLNVSSFAKYIYILSKFLDKKEANDLLTSLINSFQNLHSLIKVLRYEKGTKIFTNQYELLNSMSCEDIADDLIIVKNISTMKNQLSKANAKDKLNSIEKVVYCDALNMFSSDEITLESAQFKKIMNEFSSNKNNKIKKNGTSGQKVRNFLINNVINSRRFYYIIKNFEPKNCRSIIQNDYLVKFVLGREDMPIDQIKRYYKSITGFDSAPKKSMVEKLSNELKRVSLDNIISWGDDFLEIGNDQNNTLIEKRKTLIGLYLTVCYLVVKGIVNVNSIYLLAWSNFERDNSYINPNMDDSNIDYLELTNMFYKNKSCYQKRHKYLGDDIKSTKKKINNHLFTIYRNNVCHLNICSSFTKYLDGMGEVYSYYGIYNYCLQNYLQKEFNLSELNSKIKEYKSYNKDYLKYINMPFAYNMARYKNLTIEDLFNDKYNLEKEETNE